MSADAVRLRPLAPADVAAIADLWVEAWAATYPDIDFAARRAWFVGHLDALARDGADVLVAERESRLAGLVTVHPETGYVDQVVVARDAAGCGIGARLLAAAKARAPGGLRLQVNADNVRARRFYEREGFAVTGEGVNPSSGRPVVTMAWRPVAAD